MIFPETVNNMGDSFGLTGGWLTIWITVCCGTAMTLFGYDQGVFSGILISDDFLQTMGNPNSDMQGTITSLYDVGCFFGAVSGSYLGSRFGRKRCTIGGTIVMMIGAILQISAFSVPHMIVGRLVAGLGNGLNTAIAPVWQSETSKPSWRGKLVVLGLVLNVGGFCLSNWVDYGFAFLSGGISWRLPLALQLVFGIIILATAPWLPESPRWLLSKDREEEAMVILAALEGDGATATNPSVIAEKNDILRLFQAEKQFGLTWWDLLRNRTGKSGAGTLRRFLLGLGTQIIVQLSGVNATSYYLPIVLKESLGYSATKARLLTAINGIPYTFFSFAGMLMIDRWGRRGAMLFGTCGSAACYLVLTICIYKVQMADSTTDIDHFGDGAVAMIFIFYAFFGMGWQGTAWLYNTEINSLHMRMKGASASVAAQWAVNYMVVQITPTGIANLKWRFYLIWVFLNWCSIPILYIFYPETSNRKLEDMDQLFQDGLRQLVFLDKEACASEDAAYHVADSEHYEAV
ncbi:general substrate transporter [Xylariales sp. PMI_506]|nr:general substrate transporter [Xylariales sp. PMI_506]